MILHTEYTGAHSTIKSESDCRSRGHEFDPRLAPYFHEDWSWNVFYGLSPPSTDSRRVGVSYKQKYVHDVLVKCFVKLAQEKSVVRLTDHLDMTIAVDWDVKPQTKQIEISRFRCFLFLYEN